MKRLPEIVSFFCITVGLLNSGTIGMKPDNDRAGVFNFQTTHDTSGLVGLLKVDSFKLNIIPPSCGVQFFRNGIVFLSNTKYEGKMLPKHVSFGSIEAYTAMVKDTSLGFHMPFSTSSSFTYPCDAITFSSDYKTMYYTMISKKEKKEKIYRAEYKTDGKGEPGWATDINPLEFCTGNNIYTHPALSSDGKMMVFASDLPGTIGGLDLFIVRQDGGKWSKPENLGKTINTAQYECFPFIDTDNNLFFSSDGLTGYGGYDIFTCKFNGETWNNPLNLSQRINSAKDDIAFTIDKTDGRSAFYTSRKISASDMQLFKVEIKQDTAENNPLTISCIFNGNAVQTGFVAMELSVQNKSDDKETAKSTPPEVKKEIKSEVKNAPVTPEPKSNVRVARIVTIKLTTELPEDLKNKVVYRVQLLSSSKPRKENQVLVNSVPYKTFEYLYLGAYRYTIGEFATIAPARELQNICRKSGFPDAFVAGFKNDTRSLDLPLFK
jgi:hypothetical protein